VGYFDGVVVCFAGALVRGSESVFVGLEDGARVGERGYLVGLLLGGAVPPG